MGSGSGRRVATTGLVAALCLSPASAIADDYETAAAQGGADTITMTGECTDGSQWRIDARSQALGILLRAGVSSDAPKERWRFRVKQRGDRVAKGARKTGRNGEFVVRGRTANLPGVDVFRFVARNKTTREKCRGTLRY